MYGTNYKVKTINAIDSCVGILSYSYLNNITLGRRFVIHFKIVTNKLMTAISTNKNKCLEYTAVRHEKCLMTSLLVFIPANIGYNKRRKTLYKDGIVYLKVDREQVILSVIDDVDVILIPHELITDILDDIIVT